MREPGEGRRHLAVRWGWWVIRDAEAERVGGRDLYQQPVDDPDAKRECPPFGAVAAAGSAVLPARAPRRPVRHGRQDRWRRPCAATRRRVRVLGATPPGSGRPRIAAGSPAPQSE